MITEADLQAQLTELVAQSGALQTGHFLLASGLHARRFFRCIQLFRDPRAAEILFTGLAERFASHPVEMVLGANEAGSILAFGLAARLQAKLAIARQQDGIYHLIEGFTLLPHSRILVVDDITTTGGTVRQLLQIVRTAGAEPVGVGLIASKGLFDIDLGCPTEVLLPLEGMDAMPPDQCPLCRAGVPLST